MNTIHKCPGIEVTDPKSTAMGSGMWWAEYKEVRVDLFTAPLDCSLGHCVSQDLKMSRGIAKIFRYSIDKQDKNVYDGKAHNFRPKYGGLEELRAQHLASGGVGVLKREGRLLFYLLFTWEDGAAPPAYAAPASLLLRRAIVVQRDAAAGEKRDYRLLLGGRCC
ncbi:unnamed protein product [Acanthoscelides obtectus]|uniref:Uncharacterized protein n=1 Tax=Acanthoscelides obtectus TaxID=200917 RepID=A0A9P0JZC2_ACAOB|nr:unnamed protein product [Acanthoscelides obtectus]CAK1638076.1 O-acetyl-ADP-ribose deacetylase 1 [Acanthoscelides obtectus]